VSIATLIVNYRGYDDLDRCLESIAGQLRANDEVIVVDNESDPAALTAIANRYPQVKAIPQATNLGFAAGVNLAAQHASAPFLLLLNPDTIVEGPLLRVMEEWMHVHPHTVVLGPRVRNADGSTQPSARRFPGLSTVFGGRSTWLTRRLPNNWWSRRNLLGVDSEHPLDVDWLSGSCLLTRRDTFEEVGGFDEAFFLYWEDADYCRRVAQRGGRCTYLPSISVRHLCGGSAKYALPRAVRAFHRSAYHLFWKHAGPIKRLAAPGVYVGLMLRAEMRLRLAQRQLAASRAAQSAAPAAIAAAPINEQPARLP
jgi:GT2 family glycosyltransferase